MSNKPAIASALLGIVLMLGVAVGCEGSSTRAKRTSTIPTEFADSAGDRSAQGSVAHQPVSIPEQRRQAQANLDFTVDLLRNTAEGKSAVVSGYSVSQTLAMLSAGAQGDTATGLADAAQFVLPQSQIHDSFYHLSQVVQRTLGATLSLANAIWIQQGLTPKHAFLDVLRTQYGVGAFPLDFEADPKSAVASINGWTSRQTRGLIPVILQEGSLTPKTKIVLTNALYINAGWSKPFDATRSMPLKFWLSEDASKLTPFMTDSEREVRALASPGLDILFLGAAGGQLETIFMVPKQESLLSFEKSLSAARITELLKQAVPMQALVELPRYTVESSTSVKAFLQERGASKMFDASSNFKGITNETDRRTPAGVCGGTAIAPHWVMTAAHCVTGPSSQVRVGIPDGNDSELTRNDPVAAVFPHPGYNPTATIPSFQNAVDWDDDIALIKVTDLIDPPFANLLPPSRMSEVTRWDTVTQVGWGLVLDPFFFTSVAPVKYRQVDTSYLGNGFANCGAPGTLITGSISNSQACFGTILGLAGTCLGDSGGPSLVQRDGQWFQLSITSISFQAFCGSAQNVYPGIQTFVPNYLSWIQSIMSSDFPTLSYLPSAQIAAAVL